MPEKDLTASEKKWHKLRLFHALQRPFYDFSVIPYLTLTQVLLVFVYFTWPEVMGLVNNKRVS